ncbi:serum paraoxonase/arylesterase 2-like isoform X2 [Amphiura filiformis]|uniref:serum paraoxonase/arylesterase 2-like isoform X1 n=1 Tax=Amphiura filiformis TaxID=82378 RepID=UPI003B218971
MWKQIIITVAVVVILRHILTLGYIMGFHKQAPYRHYPGPCRIIPEIDGGSEDIALLSYGLAFISSGLKTMMVKCDEILKHQGNIFLFDFNHPEQGAIKLKLTGKDFEYATFSPHGIDAHEDKKTGVVSVFAVNHRHDQDIIEVFQFDHKSLTLQHKKSVIDPLLRSLNDVAAVSSDAFYATNDGYATSVFARQLETFMMSLKGNIVYYDGTDMRIVADKGFGDNGVTVSPDNKFLYVSQSLGMIINVYERNVDASLKLVQVIDIGTYGDNIFVEPGTGNLWIGCHPIFHKLVGHFENITVNSPSQVLHVKWEDPTRATHEYTLSEVFADTGEFLTGSTVATYHQSTKGLLIGTTTTKLAYCQVIAF